MGFYILRKYIVGRFPNVGASHSVMVETMEEKDLLSYCWTEKNELQNWHFNSAGWRLQIAFPSVMSLDSELDSDSHFAEKETKDREGKWSVPEEVFQLNLVFSPLLVTPGSEQLTPTWGACRKNRGSYQELWCPEYTRLLVIFARMKLLEKTVTQLAGQSPFHLKSFYSLKMVINLCIPSNQRGCSSWIAIDAKDDLQITTGPQLKALF